MNFYNVYNVCKLLFRFRLLTPWTAMMTDKDLVFDDRKSVTKSQAHEGLVGGASLIDKAPNLGGLCRTCEILGVGALVIQSYRKKV